TLYRRFPTKAALVDAVVLAEARRYLEGDAQAWAQGATFEDRMVNSTVFSVTFMREHALLKKLLRKKKKQMYKINVALTDLLTCDRLDTQQSRFARVTDDLYDT
ncbi:hypothetical protein, partial [Streptococcus pyogenes]|uniref:hypothetical protein n=1 Tax=Streptococcus pyogenes TaxID=1314 RepID=UPI001C72328B